MFDTNSRQLKQLPDLHRMLECGNRVGERFESSPGYQSYIIPDTKAGILFSILAFLFIIKRNAVIFPKIKNCLKMGNEYNVEKLA